MAYRSGPDERPCPPPASACPARWSPAWPPPGRSCATSSAWSTPSRPRRMAEAEAAARTPDRCPDLDRTDLPLFTVDPEGSRDLDQAVGIERRPGGYRVHYAIADVAAFVDSGRRPRRRGPPARRHPLRARPQRPPAPGGPERGRGQPAARPGPARPPLDARPRRRRRAGRTRRAPGPGPVPDEVRLPAGPAAARRRRRRRRRGPAGRGRAGCARPGPPSGGRCTCPRPSRRWPREPTAGRAWSSAPSCRPRRGTRRSAC